jgi:hypothetical protein
MTCKIFLVASFIRTVTLDIPVITCSMQIWRQFCQQRTPVTCRTIIIRGAWLIPCMIVYNGLMFAKDFSYVSLQLSTWAYTSRPMSTCPSTVHPSHHCPLTVAFVLPSQIVRLVQWTDLERVARGLSPSPPLPHNLEFTAGLLTYSWSIDGRVQA